VNSEQPVGDPVKRADPQRRRRQVEHRFDAPTHLAGGLVRERHRKNGVRRDVLDFDEPRHTMREHARLAAAGTGEHESRCHRCGHGLPLCVVQTVEQVGYIHGGRNCTLRCPHATG